MIVDRAPHYKAPFDNVYAEVTAKIYENVPDEETLKKRFEHHENMFNKYYNSVKYTLRYLELIEWRFKKEKDIYQKIQIEQKNAKNYNDNIEVGKKLFWITELLQLDIESFYIYAGIVIDILPYLFGSIEYLIIIQNGNKPIPKRSFDRYLFWFEQNPDKILDTKYVELLNKFKPIFYGEIKNPRDKRIVHKGEKSYLHGLKNDGVAIREIYGTRNIFEFTDISILMYKILDFFESLDKYFSQKLKSI